MEHDQKELAVCEGRAFRIINKKDGRNRRGSLVFAALIPGEGFSRSRCSCCYGEVPYHYQRCRTCDLPLIGPFGFMPLALWLRLGPGQRAEEVRRVWRNDAFRGRVAYMHEPAFPLTRAELEVAARLKGNDAERFALMHGIAPSDLLLVRRW